MQDRTPDVPWGRPAFLLWRSLAGWALDAPLIAGAWAVALAVAAGVTVDGVTLAGLTMAAWWVYTADRLVDIRLLAGTAGPRHQTIGSHPRAAVVLLVAVAAGLAGLVFFMPQATVLSASGVAAVGAVGWWLGRAGGSSHRADTRAALLAGGFAVATWLPGAVHANLPAVQVALTLLPWSALLWFNVRLTEWWERHEDDGRPAAAAPPAAVRRGGLLTAGVLLAVWSATGSVGSVHALTALPAWWVHWLLSDGKITAHVKRSVADAALLLPPILLIIFHTLK